MINWILDRITYFLVALMAFGACEGCGSAISTAHAEPSYGYVFVSTQRYPFFHERATIRLRHARLRALGYRCQAFRVPGYASIICSNGRRSQRIQDFCGDGKSETMTVGVVPMGIRCE